MDSLGFISLSYAPVLKAPLTFSGPLLQSATHGCIVHQPCMYNCCGVSSKGSRARGIAKELVSEYTRSKPYLLGLLTYPQRCALSHTTFKELQQQTRSTELQSQLNSESSLSNVHEHSRQELCHSLGLLSAMRNQVDTVQAHGLLYSVRPRVSARHK